MANEEQVKILKQGVQVWNEWRKVNHGEKINLILADLEGADIAGANLEGATLDGANLIFANLRRSNLKEASLIGTDFMWADLRYADLRNSIIEGTDFEEADLSWIDFEGTIIARSHMDNADLREANLIKACFRNSYLLGADLSGAKFQNSDFYKTVVGNTIFGFNDLSQILHLETLEHKSPSVIGVETIFNSKGKIPELFLRGCGLSDLQIEIAKFAAQGLDPKDVTDITYNIHQLYLGSGIQYYSCFISYNSKDQDFAKQLHDDLQNNGVRCWFPPEDMKIGDPIRPTVDHQIRLRDKLLVILSENSVKSEWVGDEVEAALEEESKSNRLVLSPIRLDDSVMNTRADWAAKIKRRRHIGDFSNWKDKASYHKAFERLLRDLKAMGGGVNGE